VLRPPDESAQFCSGDYHRFLKLNDLLCSISAVGHCGDNAACEGFLGVLKRERVNRTKYRTRDIAKSDLFDFIECFHNQRKRRRVVKRALEYSAVLKPSVEVG